MSLEFTVYEELACCLLVLRSFLLIPAYGPRSPKRLGLIEGAEQSASLREFLYLRRLNLYAKHGDLNHKDKL